VHIQINVSLKGLNKRYRGKNSKT